MKVNPCNCICHEVFGGGAHEHMTCVCKGGAGFDDLSALSDPALARHYARTMGSES